MKFVPMNLNVTLHQWMYSNATPLLFRLTTKSSKQQKKRSKQSTVTRQLSSKLHTNQLIELRPFADDNLG